MVGREDDHAAAGADLLLEAPKEQADTPIEAPDLVEHFLAVGTVAVTDEVGCGKPHSQEVRRIVGSERESIDSVLGEIEDHFIEVRGLSDLLGERAVFRPFAREESAQAGKPVREEPAVLRLASVIIGVSLRQIAWAIQPVPYGTGEFRDRIEPGEPSRNLGCGPSAADEPIARRKAPLLRVVPKDSVGFAAPHQDGRAILAGDRHDARSGRFLLDPLPERRDIEVAERFTGGDAVDRLVGGAIVPLVADDAVSVFA